MRKKIVGFVFAAALLAAMAVPLFSGGGTALATHGHQLVTPGTTVDDIASGQTSNDGNGCHKWHDNVHTAVPGEFAIGNDKGFDGQPNNPVMITGDSLIACP
ncbi:MAG: hypothetical protein ACE5I2_14400 [Anaerolineae bacterium]